MLIKTAIIVVLYNKQIDESATIRTLIGMGLKNAELVIHNNGPKTITLPPGFAEHLAELNNVKVVLVNCINNKPLSFLYNDFIVEYSDSEKFVLLDDDSEITSTFMDAIYENDYDLEIPKIISRVDNETYYPLCDGQVVTYDGFLKIQGTHSIGSGLIFTKKFVDIFNKNKIKLFDENYALYGVDVSLFRRMWRLNRNGEVFKLKTSSNIVHSLSRAEGKQSAFRNKERLIDYAISVRRYPSFRAYASFIKKGIKQLIKFRLKDFCLMCASFLSGIHPRSKMWKSIN